MKYLINVRAVTHTSLMNTANGYLESSQTSRIQENLRLDEDVLKTSFVFLFRRRLDQDEYIRLSHSSSEDVFKTS